MTKQNAKDKYFRTTLTINRAKYPDICKKLDEENAKKGKNGIHHYIRELVQRDLAEHELVETTQYTTHTVLLKNESNKQEAEKQEIEKNAISDLDCGAFS